MQFLLSNNTFFHPNTLKTYNPKCIEFPFYKFMLGDLIKRKSTGCTLKTTTCNLHLPSIFFPLSDYTKKLFMQHKFRWIFITELALFKLHTYPYMASPPYVPYFQYSNSSLYEMEEKKILSFHSYFIPKKKVKFLPPSRTKVLYGTEEFSYMPSATSWGVERKF